MVLAFKKQKKKKLKKGLMTLTVDLVTLKKVKGQVTTY